MRLILFIYCMLLYGSDMYSQTNKCDTTFYIKFDFVKYGHVLDVNAIDKFNVPGELCFSKGMDSMGEINRFYIDHKKKRRKLGLAELNKISFISVDDFVEYTLKHPAKKNFKINIVEIPLNGGIPALYYDARWERRTFIE